MFTILGVQVAATALTTVCDAVALPRPIISLYSFLIDLGAAAGPFVAYILGDKLGPYATFQGTALLLLALAAQSCFRLRRVFRE